MARFLSAAWVDECNVALDGTECCRRRAPRPAWRPPTGRFVVAQEVHGTPDGDVRLVMAVADGRVRFDVGPLGDRNPPARTPRPGRTPTSPSSCRTPTPQPCRPGR